jgi:hypothetical protein
MIVRILGEGQYDVPDDAVEGLNVCDEAVVAAGFVAALAELLKGVHAAGTPTPLDALVPSDLVLPGADASLEEVRELLGDEGLIPG